MHAGHFFSVGKYPSVRFDEDNVHGQCSYCNSYSKDGHLHYRDNLIKKIGSNKLNLLESKAHKPLKLTRVEIQEKIKYYRSKNKGG